MAELYLHSPVCFHGVVVNKQTQGQVYPTPHLIAIVKKRLCKFLWYVIGMNETRMAIKTFEHKQEERGNIKDSA
jgi:hypothetical protein